MNSLIPFVCWVTDLFVEVVNLKLLCPPHSQVTDSVCLLGDRFVRRRSESEASMSATQ
jgi:hypothetical protein